MLIIDPKNLKEMIASDNTFLKELLSPLKDDVNIRHSIALARVEPGKKSYKHRLNAAETYIILDGEGEMYIDDEHARVSSGQIVHIPANSVQNIKNIGAKDLVFLCIVDPPWEAKNDTNVNE